MKKVFATFILIIGILILNISSAYSKELNDLLGRKVTFKENPQKVLAIGPGAIRYIIYFNLDNRLIGLEASEMRYPKQIPYFTPIEDEEKIKKLPIIGEGGPGRLPNLEKVLLLKPDIIIASMISPSQIKLLESKLNIPIFVVGYGVTDINNKNISKLDSIKKSMELMGEVFQEQKRANELLSFIKNSETELKNIIKNKDSSVYVSGLGHRGAQGITSTEGYEFLPFKLLGLKNVLMKDVAGHRFIQKEAILKVNPQYIFLDEGGKNVFIEDFKRSKKFYDSLKATKNKNIVWILPNNFYGINVENNIINAYIISSVINKKELDLKKMQNIYKLFYKNRWEKVFNRHFHKLEVVNF